VWVVWVGVEVGEARRRGVKWDNKHGRHEPGL